MEKKGKCGLTMLYIGRTLTWIITFAMFGGAGYGFYRLNEFTLEVINFLI
jgi:hypothetical protein